MGVQKYVLYIEGTTDDTNGDLRQGFSSLLSKKLEGRMPRIRMADGKSQAISKFKKPLANDNPILIIDLDDSPNAKDDVLKKEGLISHSKEVFFMIQEMEGWFFSQPGILDEFYNHPISHKIRRNPVEIENPSDELFRLTKNISKKDPYHKVRHGVALLKMLDIEALIRDFQDVKELVEILNK